MKTNFVKSLSNLRQTLSHSAVCSERERSACGFAQFYRKSVSFRSLSLAPLDPPPTYILSNSTCCLSFLGFYIWIFSENFKKSDWLDSNWIHFPPATTGISTNRNFKICHKQIFCGIVTVETVFLSIFELGFTFCDHVRVNKTERTLNHFLGIYYATFHSQKPAVL